MRAPSSQQASQSATTSGVASAVRMPAPGPSTRARADAAGGSMRPTRPPIRPTGRRRAASLPSGGPGWTWTTRVTRLAEGVGAAIRVAGVGGERGLVGGDRGVLPVAAALDLGVGRAVDGAKEPLEDLLGPDRGQLEDEPRQPRGLRRRDPV